MKLKFIPALIALGAIYMGIAACNGHADDADQIKDSTALASADSGFRIDTSAPQIPVVKLDTVPYTIAENYFIKNNVKDTVPPKITTKEDFGRYFGMAPLMGKNGKPTPIDFGKQFVIVVDYPETKRNIDMQPGQLIKNGQDIIFNFKINKGKQMRYTIRPFLMIVVDNQHNGNLILHNSK